MTDQNGEVVWFTDYAPFGYAFGTGEVGVTNKFRFPGQYDDGYLYYNHHRYYVPDTGRYNQVDPIISESNNNYLYSGNNPIMFIDPFGYFSYYKDPKVKPANSAMEIIIKAFETCMGFDVIVTSGTRADDESCKSGTVKGHCTGDAADFGWNNNPKVKANKDKALCCAKKAKAQFAYWEDTCLHIQTHKGKGGATKHLPSEDEDCSCK